MATVRYSIKSNSNPANIYCRYVNGRSVDITTCMNILVNPKFWDHKNGKVRNVLEMPNSDDFNKRLMLLEVHIYDSFNNAYMDGKIIDKQWLDNSISEFFSRPKDEVKIKNKNHTIYYTDFAQWWLDNKASTWLIGNHEYLPQREIDKYSTFIGMVIKFQGKNKIKLTEVSNHKIIEFVDYLNENDYASSTIKRHISRFKFFCLRAEDESFSINSSFKNRVFSPKEIEIKEAYLNPEEIDKIYNHDFSNDDRLDNVRDNLIIAVWTGLRVSDFLNKLDIKNFIDDYIELTTTKTETPVVIPVHPQIKRILIKRNGQLPRKISDQRFNEYVKEVCEKVGISEIIKGKLFDKDKNRKVVGFYPKHKLVSSHIGRRSFATNLYGKIPNSVIMGVCGWAKEDMMLHYIKKSNRDHAVELKNYWEKTNI